MVYNNNNQPQLQQTTAMPQQPVSGLLNQNNAVNMNYSGMAGQPYQTNVYGGMYNGGYNAGYNGYNNYTPNYNQLLYGRNAYPYYNQYMYNKPYLNQNGGINMMDVGGNGSAGGVNNNTQQQQQVQMQQQMQQQPMTQQSAQQIIMQYPQPSFTWVQGEAGAKAYPVQAGNTVMLMDAEEPVFYIKTTDVNGVPMPLEAFEYKSRVRNKDVSSGATATGEVIGSNGYNNTGVNTGVNNTTTASVDASTNTPTNTSTDTPINSATNTAVVANQLYITREEFEEFEKRISSSIEKGFNNIRGQKNHESFVQSDGGRKQNSKPTKQPVKSDTAVQ